jgi:trehalose 6-phosphate phosphatase
LGCDTAVYVGDDETDDDVFKLKDARSLLTVRIEPDPASDASFFLSDQHALDRLLQILIEARADRRALGAL